MRAIRTVSLVLLLSPCLAGCGASAVTSPADLDSAEDLPEVWQEIDELRTADEDQQGQEALGADIMEEPDGSNWPFLPVLCQPCDQDDACWYAAGRTGTCDRPDSRSGGFCSVVCNVPEDCPTGYSCLPIDDVRSLCRPAEGGCLCREEWIARRLSTTCWTLAPMGRCLGVRTCSSSGLTPCSAEDPGDDVCDGQDNDCDGDVDEGILCDDANPCTHDECRGPDGCEFVPLALACDDGNACTVNDRCGNGTCVPGSARECNDLHPCTQDLCDPVGGCVHLPACPGSEVCDAQGFCCLPRWSCGDPAHECRQSTDGCGNPMDCGDCLDPLATCVNGICHPAECSLNGLTLTGGPALDVLVHGGHAYVALGASGLAVFDVHQPAVPHLAHLERHPDGAFLLARDSSFLYVAGKESLNMYSLAVPSLPVWVSSVPFMVGGRSMATEMGLIFLARADRKIAVVDATQPLQAAVRSIIDLGTRIPVSLAVRNAVLAVGTSHSGLVLFDVSDLDAPVELATVSPAEPCHCIAMEGSRLHLAQPSGGLHTYDLTHPSAPVKTSTLPLSPSAGPCLLVGSVLLLPTAGDTLTAVDLIAGSSIRAHALPNGPLLSGLDVSGDFLYLADGFLGVSVVAVPGYGQFVPVSRLLLPVFNIHLLESNGWMAAVQGMGWLDILDMKDPWNLTVLERLPLPGMPVEAVVGQDVLYVASIMAGLLVVPGSLPDLLPPVGGNSTLLAPSGLHRDGDLLAVVDLDGSLALFDVHHPLDPQLLSHLKGEGSWMDVKLHQHRAWIAADSGGVVAVDVSLPQVPVPLAQYPAPLGRALQVEVDEQALYVLFYRPSPAPLSRVVRYGIGVNGQLTNDGVVAQGLGWAWFARVGPYIALVTEDTGVSLFLEDGSQLDQPQAVLPVQKATSPPLFFGGFLFHGTESGIATTDARGCR